MIRCRTALSPCTVRIDQVNGKERKGTGKRKEGEVKDVCV